MSAGCCTPRVGWMEHRHLPPPALLLLLLLLAQMSVPGPQRCLWRWPVLCSWNNGWGKMCVSKRCRYSMFPNPSKLGH